MYNSKQTEDRMEKEMGNIKFTETDDGYRIDIQGKDLKEAFGCCFPMAGMGKGMKIECCATEEEKK